MPTDLNTRPTGNASKAPAAFTFKEFTAVFLSSSVAPAALALSLASPLAVPIPSPKAVPVPIAPTTGALAPATVPKIPAPAAAAPKPNTEPIAWLSLKATVSSSAPFRESKSRDSCMYSRAFS